jgi:hypothetical protein
MCDVRARQPNRELVVIDELAKQIDKAAFIQRIQCRQSIAAEIIVIAVNR